MSTPAASNVSGAHATDDARRSSSSAGYPSELERGGDSTKDGLDGRGAGGVLRLSDSVTLILGDCLAHLPIDCDAVVTDPPYGIANLSEKRARLSSGGRQLRNPITKSDGLKYRKHEGVIIGDAEPFDPSPWLQWPCVLWGAGYYHERLPRGGWLLWDKKCTGGYEGWDGGDGDMAWISRECAPRVFRMVWMGVARGEVEKANGGQNAKSAHPNQKPVALMGWSMDKLRVPVGATVLDPYMGSGSTGLACIRTGRRFIGIECDPVHFKTAELRIRRELEECVFEFPKGQDGGERQEAFDLEPRSSPTDPSSPTGSP